VRRNGRCGWHGTAADAYSLPILLNSYDDDDDDDDDDVIIIIIIIVGSHLDHQSKWTAMRFGSHVSQVAY
jgi:hypothetical protein